MAHFLHLHEWLSSTEALSYLKIKDIDVSLRELLKAYTTLEFELKIDFKNPTTYAFKLEVGKTYPRSLFRNQFPEWEEQRHELGVLIRLYYPESISAKVFQRGYADDAVVWIYSSLDDESLLDESYRNVPVYVKWDGHWTANHSHDFEMLTWGMLLGKNPDLLLFNRTRLDTLVVSEETANTKEKRPTSNGNSTDRLATKERNTLLILIAALCNDAKIDYKQRGVAIAIQQMTENIGAPVTDDTIKRILGQIESALDSRGK